MSDLSPEDRLRRDAEEKASGKRPPSASRGKWMQGLGIAGCVVLFGVWLGIGLSGGFDQPNVAAGATPVAPPASEPARPDNACDAIKEALGESNRKVQRVESCSYSEGYYDVRWSIDDNLTEGMVKESAKIDMVNILKAVASCAVPVESAHLVGTYGLVDKFGNVSEDPVVKASFTGETIHKIQFDTFLTDNIYDIAGSYWKHRTFEDPQ